MKRIPEFTAEVSLHETNEQYNGTANQPAFIGGETIMPQLFPPHCGPCRNGWKLCCGGIDCYPVRCTCRYICY